LLFLPDSSGCKDDEAVTGIDFDVTFKATYNGAQLEKNTDYVFGTYPLQFIRYRLYLSDITLLKTNGKKSEFPRSSTLILRRTAELQIYLLRQKSLSKMCRKACMMVSAWVMA
jgi:hypothetical protein